MCIRDSVTALLDPELPAADLRCATARLHRRMVLQCDPARAIPLHEIASLINGILVIGVLKYRMVQRERAAFDRRAVLEAEGDRALVDSLDLQLIERIDERTI